MKGAAPAGKNGYDSTFLTKWREFPEVTRAQMGG